MGNTIYNSPLKFSYLGGLVTCVLIGLVAALAYTAFAVFILVVRGTAPFTAHDTTFLEATGAYLIGFPTAGVVAGLLNPLARTQYGAGILGALAGAVAVLVTSRLLTGHFLSSDQDTTIATAATGIILGTSFGLILWHQIVKPGAWPHAHQRTD